MKRTFIIVDDHFYFGINIMLSKVEERTLILTPLQYFRNTFFINYIFSNFINKYIYIYIYILRRYIHVIAILLFNNK